MKTLSLREVAQLLCVTEAAILKRMQRGDKWLRGARIALPGYRRVIFSADLIYAKMIPQGEIECRSTNAKLRAV